jgi:hypothetical protein
MPTLRIDFFDPALPELACLAGDFWAATLADFFGALVATGFAAGGGAVLATFVAPALAFESVFLAAGCVFFVSVVALAWPPRPRPNKAPTSTATLITCFICHLQPVPREFYPSLANEMQKSTEIDR